MTGVGIFRGIMIAVSAGLLAPAAQANNWAAQLFPVKQHEFGTVAVASDTKFRFPIENTTNQDIHIASVRASCGCTTPIVETEWIRAGERGAILAQFNTDTFRGKKGATLTVVIDKPAYAEVRLRVDGYIRRDIVFHPGSVDFGNVSQGSIAEKTVKIAYAGRSDWEILDVESNVPYLKTDLKQLSRGGERVDYELTVQLADQTPAGFLQQELVLVTNDRSMPRVPLRVHGQVEAGLTVSPAAIAIGSVKPGESVEQRIVVRGQEPFTIESITCEGWDIQFEPPSTAKKTHLISLTLTPGSDAGDFRGNLVIRTAGGESLNAHSLLTANIRDK